MAITQSDVSQACEKIVALGKTPTLQAIRDSIGGGSFSTIAKMLKVWSDGGGAVPVSESNPLPASVLSSLNALGAAVWSAANQALSEDRKQYQKQFDELQEQSNSAFAIADQKSVELDELKKQFDEIKKQNEQLKIELADCRGRLSVFESMQSILKTKTSADLPSDSPAQKKKIVKKIVSSE